MPTRLKCKICNDIITTSLRNTLVYCGCGMLGVEDMGHGSVRVLWNGSRDNYCNVDDEGNEVLHKEVMNKTTTNEESEPNQPKTDHKTIMKEFMLSLTHQIEGMENLSSSGKFSPATNQDLLAHFVWLREYLRALEWKEKEETDSLSSRFANLLTVVEDQERLLSSLSEKQRAKSSRKTL